jgi:hypothetical protein
LNDGHYGNLFHKAQLPKKTGMLLIELFKPLLHQQNNGHLNQFQVAISRCFSIVVDREGPWTRIRPGDKKKDRPREDCLKKMQCLIDMTQECILVMNDKTVITAYKKR